ncbi:hypothetical protein DPMN_168493 [Dreissena polymorpha]|uniref:Uncharacterized protein n=1 Tax=Dreissena polymorpha TaxID=45954 RepID=A0A9D4IVZ4_DREPO|nr:hypothetical protein DPMN_168493 [Dreissena polymorpha]
MNYPIKVKDPRINTNLTKGQQNPRKSCQWPQSLTQILILKMTSIVFLKNRQDDSTQSDKEGDDFWEDLDDFCAEMNDMGDPVSDKIAEVCNRSIKNKASDKKIKEIKSGNKRPKNVEYLQIPRVEEFLWRQLHSSTRANNFMLQKSHGTLAQAAVPIVKALDHVQQSVSKYKVLKGHLSDAFKLLTNGIAQNVAVRREKIKRDMQPKYIINFTSS